MSQSPLAPSAEEQIRRTIAEYCHFTDLGDYDRWVGLFTEDGAFHMFGQSYVGHAVLRAFIMGDQPPERRGLHLTTDSVIKRRGVGIQASSESTGRGSLAHTSRQLAGLVSS